MSLTPTPVTAALAGTFSGLTWPWVWPYFSGAAALDTVWLMLGTIVLIGLPAHAFVLGFRPARTVNAGAVDHALLLRVATWLAGAVTAALLLSALRGSA
jgi:hypothetical protein